MSDSSPSSSDSEAVDGMPFSMHDLNISDLIFEDSSFARGAFGRMVKADYFGVTVCVKILKKQRKKELAKFVHREMAALKTLSHPNLVQFIGLTEKGNEICLVTEYISGGTLRKLLKDRSISIPWHVRVQIAVDISSAMTYLHSRKIMHRDLKSKNLLVGDNWKIKICDFGFARSVHDKKKTAALTFCGTEEYMAPEVIFGMEYDERAEVYSYGLLLCEIMTRQKVEETVPRTSNTNYGLDHQEITAHIPRDCPIELLQLAFLCTEYEPKNRPEFREITQILREIKQNVAPSPVIPVRASPTPAYVPPPTQVTASPAHVPSPALAPTPAPSPQVITSSIPALASSPPPQLPPPISLEDDLSKSFEDIPLNSPLPPPFVENPPSPVEKAPQNGRESYKTVVSTPPAPLRNPAPAPFRRSPSAPIVPVPQKNAAGKPSAKDSPKAPGKREPPGPSKLGKPPAAVSKPITNVPAKTAPGVKAAVEEILSKPVPPLTRTSSSTFPTPKPALSTSPPSKVPATNATPSSRAAPTKISSSPTSPPPSPSPSPTPPKAGVPVLPKVAPSVTSPASSPRSLPTKDRPTSPVAKPSPPNRVGFFSNIFKAPGPAK